MMSSERIHTSTNLYAELREDSIRVLDILPGSDGTQIKAILRTVLLDQEPQYEALSYTWGEQLAGKDAILINSVYEFPVRPNLHLALLRLRKESQPRTLWIDAICINQLDLKERSQQVAVMGKIYQQASCVNVWLGEHWESTSPVNLKPIVSARTWLGAALFRGHNTMKNALSNTPKAIDMALKSSSAQWHERAWIIQEFVLAREVYLCFGDRRLLYDAEWLRNALRILEPKTTPQFAKFASRLERELDPLRKRFHGEAKPSRAVNSSFMAAVQAIRGASATEQRDLVYSILGLISPEQANLIGSDYTVSFRRLCARATFASMKTRRNLDMLALVHFDRDETDYSWTVDFSNIRHSVAIDLPLHGTFALWLRRIRYPSQNVHLSNGIALTLQGAIFDTLECVMPLDSDFDRNLNDSGWDQVKDFVYQSVSAASKTLQQRNASAPKVGMAILEQCLGVEASPEQQLRPWKRPNEVDEIRIPGRTWKNNVGSRAIDGFRLWSAFLCAEQNDIMAAKERTRNSHIQRFWGHASIAGNGVSLFSTSSGLLGLAPASVEKGDKIALFDNNCHFIVIRPHHEEHHRFRGLAFVNDLVDLEIWQSWKNTNFQPHDIHLI